MASIRKEQLAGYGAHYMYYPWEYVLQSQAELGFCTIELWGGSPHFLLNDYSYSDTAAVKKLAESYGLHIGAFAPESAAYQYLICAHDPVARAHSLGYYQNAIRAAGELGSSVMPLSCGGGDWSAGPEKAFSLAVDMLGQLADMASSYGVVLAIETMPQTNILNRIEDLQRLIDTVNHPNIAVTLNLTAACTAGESISDWFRVFGSKLRHVHFADGRPSGSLCWGDGILPLPEYLRTLEEFSYQGLIGLRIDDFRYYAQPKEADRRNLNALKPYIGQEE